MSLKCAVWEFTLKCNLRCSHCGSSAGKARENELSTKECISLCESLAELGCEEVSLMGGEPFLRDDWFSVGSCIRDLGMDLSFVSNGTIDVERAVSLEPKVVGISLDGSEETHDRIRGKGSYVRAMRAIELLKERGIETTVITTVSRINLMDLPKMNLDGVNWQIQVAAPIGNFSREDMLSKEEFYASALFIAKKRRGMNVVGAHCYGFFSRFLPCDWKGCTAGITSMGITSDGSIVGCLSMGNDRFIEGNVREKSLKDIWTDADAFSYNRKFDRSALGPNCRDCRHGMKCRGGCNSMSCSITGSFHNDPYCFYRIERETKI